MHRQFGRSTIIQLNTPVHNKILTPCVELHRDKHFTVMTLTNDWGMTVNRNDRESIQQRLDRLENSVLSSSKITSSFNYK